MAAAPRLGIYVGTARDVSCPGDHVTYELTLLTAATASLEGIPELSFFKGGSPPWRAEATWEQDGDELVVTITQQDTTGPRKDTDLTLSWRSDDTVVFRNTTLKWTQPPPEKDPLQLQREQLAEQAAASEAQLRQLRAQRELLEQQEAEHQSQQAELQRLQQELQRQREEAAERAQALEAQRALLAEQRQQAEAERAAVEAQREAAQAAREAAEAERQEAEARRAAALEEARLRQEELDRQRSEVEQTRLEEERLRVAQADLLSYRDRELQSRAKQLQATEQVLLAERRSLHQGRAQLAVVQSHVLGMLGGKDKAGDADAIIQKARLDQSDEPETTDGPDGEEAAAALSPSQRGVDVYDVDWATVQGGAVKENIDPADWS